MRTFLLSVVFLLLSQNIATSGDNLFFGFFSKSAETAYISGIVTDADTDEEIAGAEVWLFGSDGGYIKGTQTDVSGRFSFPDVPLETVTIKVTHLGYNVFEDSLDCAQHHVYTIDIALHSFI